MYRTRTCGDLTILNVDEQVTLSGWVHKSRDLGGMTFIDMRDRYGITQLVFNMETDAGLCEEARKLGREYVIQVKGLVTERSNKNKNIPTGEIEIVVNALTVLSKSEVPPFTIENETDGGEELRMKFRYLDLRRTPLKEKIMFRHQVAIETRNYLNNSGFVEIETPYLIKSTPEGARDFVVPSRMNAGQFYALPQSPQTFKQLLMISGFDRYYQLVRCFRDEDLRADRQPEFTQIDCEMSFVDREDILEIFEGLVKHLLQTQKGFFYEGPSPRMTYREAMENYGTDKPDIRFDIKIHDLTSLVKGHGFRVFDDAEYVGGIAVPGLAGYSRKQLDQLTDFVTRPQIGAKGLIYVKANDDKTYKSSVDKFFEAKDFESWFSETGGHKGDLLLVLSGEKAQTLFALSELRLEMGTRLQLRDPEVFKPLWILDFPLLEWDEESKRYHAKHHPFTAPKQEDIALLDKSPGEVRAEAYDMVINGVEIGGGSIRIHDRKLQEEMFSHLGFTHQEAQSQFGFLMDAFRYGAPPHGGIAFGFDRMVALLDGSESIRDYIAFPKNNSGRDLMIKSPSDISREQLKELHLRISQDDE